MHSQDESPVTGILRLMVRATASDTVESLSNLDDSNERRRKAIESILFSRRFINSYNLVILAVIICYSSWYWILRSLWARRRRAGDHGNHRKGSKSALLAREADQETTPLLESSKSRHHHQSSSHSLSSVVRSWMVYQPANVPYVQKVFPSNAITLTILLFLGLNLFYLFYRVPLSVDNAFVFADRAGLLFVANLPLLYVLAAKNQPFKLLADASYEGLNIIHRRLGEWMCLLALLHGASMLLVYYITLSSRLSLSRFLALPIIWLGLSAFTFYEMLYLTSLGSFRQKFYELFLALHVFLQATALGFLFFHHHNSRPYVLIALGIFAVDRLGFRLWLKSRTLQAELSVLDDGETVMLSSNWHLQARAWRPGLDIRSGWKPAEHVFLTVPALSHKHVVQAHPFTIASAAPQGPGSHAWLNFVIRAQDGFSRDLLRYAHLHRSTSIRVDGPYGSNHALHMLHDNEMAVVVAGGSGIAIAFPLVWSLFTARPRDQQYGQTPRVSLIWVVQDSKHLDWIPQDRLEELREFGCKIILPSPTHKAGRPDLPLLIEGAISAWSDEVEDPTVGVVVSGPDGMNRTCRNACASLIRRGVKLDVSVEKFGW